MSKSDEEKSAPPKRSSGLLSSLFGAANATGGEERIEYLEDEEADAVPYGEERAFPGSSGAAYEAAHDVGAVPHDVFEDEGAANGTDAPYPNAQVVGYAASGAVQDVSLSHDEVYTKTFSDVANARLWRRTGEAKRRAKETSRSFRDVFTPTRPKRRSEEFLGRRAVIGAVVEAIEEEHAHVMVCGQSGLGKTSLANVVNHFAKNSGYLISRVTGTEDLTFSQLIRSVFEDLYEQIEQTPSGDLLWEKLGVSDLSELLNDSSLDLVSEFLGEDSLNVNRVIRALAKLSDHRAIVMVDDYEQIKSKDLKTKLCQVMKALSDQGGWLSFMILGRAESPSDLMQDDVDGLSNAVGVYMDPFTAYEVEEVILEGARRVALPFTEDTVEAIVRLSQGVPNVVQWLCFLAARRATRRQSGIADMEDLAEIVFDAVTKLDPKLRNQYDEACRFDTGRDNADLLYLAVRAPCTTSGLFSAASMAVLSKQIIARSWTESELHTALLPLCGKSKTAILRKLDTSEGIFYRFAHPAMRAVVMLKKIVRIPLLADSRTRDVDEAILALPEAEEPAEHGAEAPQEAQDTAEGPQAAPEIEIEPVSEAAPEPAPMSEPKPEPEAAPKVKTKSATASGA